MGTLKRMIVIGALAVALVGCALFTAAQIPGEGWERIAVLGAATNVVAPSPDFSTDNTVFAGTDGLGVWRSTDGGVTWSQSTTATALAHARVMDLVVSPEFSSDHIVVAITYGGEIYRSINADGTFTFSLVMASPGAPGMALAASPAWSSQRVLFAGFFGKGLYWSGDAGDSWTLDTTSRDRVASINDLAISPDFGSDQEIYVGGVDQNGCLWLRKGLSTATWTAKWGATGGSLGDGQTENVTSLLYPGGGFVWAGTRSHGMWKTTTGGASWTALWDGAVGTTRPRVNVMARTGGTTIRLLEGREDGPYWSSSDGASAALTTPSMTTRAAAFEPEWDGSTKCLLFLGGPNGLYRKNTCTSAFTKPTGWVDARAVAIAAGGNGKFMGSQGQGLFKSIPNTSNDYPMVRYNNFPSGLVPEIVSICLGPQYDETYVFTGSCTEREEGVVVVGANFSASPSDNGVYLSIDFGATWTKLATNWPTGNPVVNDLVMSPLFDIGTSDTTLFVATSIGLYRWDGGTSGWVLCFNAPAYAVGIPPTYSRTGASGFPRHTVFVSTDDGADNEIWYSNADGAIGGWIKTGYPGTTAGRVTSFAFPYNFGLTGYSTQVFVSAIQQNAPSPVQGAGGVYTSNGSAPWSAWYNASLNLGTSPSVWEIVAEPRLFEPAAKQSMICASDRGLYRTTNAGASPPTNISWAREVSQRAFSAAYQPDDTAGNVVMAGFQLGRKKDASDPDPPAAALSDNAGDSFAIPFTNYGYLPEDVWSTVAHERDPNVLFCASESMGVFVSQDKGVSFRPWNKGMGGTSGPCMLRTGLGISMLADRRGTNLDIVWAGTVSEGIKARYIWYDSTAPVGQRIKLEEESSGTPNGWRHCTWRYPTSPTVDQGVLTGRFERIEVVPYTAQSNRVMAASPTLGMYELWSGSWWTVWFQQNAGLGTDPPAKGVRHGYAAPTALTSGSGVAGSVAQDDFKYYYLDVPAGTDTFQCQMVPSAGDPDVYIRYAALPTETAWQYRPYVSGTETICVPTFLLNESFSAGIPGTWTVVNGGSGGGAAATWTTANPCSRSIGAPFSGAFAIVDSDCAGQTATQDEQLITPSFATRGYDSVILEFSNQFRYWAGKGAESLEVCDVDVSLNGGSSWTNVLKMLGGPDGYPVPNTKVVDISSLARNRSSVTLRFHYYNATWEYWWAIDNVKVRTGPAPIQPGRWYIGIRGYEPGTNSYTLTATLDGCALGFVTEVPEEPKKEERGGRAEAAGSPSSPEEGGGPEAPGSGTIWGTVHRGGGGGVFQGTSSAGIMSWTAHNGVPPNELTNTLANTVIQLADLTLIVGCEGDVFYSPAPDQGVTTWVNATAHVANAGSNDFRDLLECSNGDALIAANGTGASNPGGVWLSGDKGAHWMRISQGFDAEKQALEDLVVDGSDPPQYYSSTDSTGAYTRTITASDYPTVTSTSPSALDPDGGSVTVRGTGFYTGCPTGDEDDCEYGDPVVLIDGVEVSTSYVNASTLTAAAPAHVPGSVSITVRNPDTRLSSPLSVTYACVSPSGTGATSGYDLSPYAFTGVDVLWSADPSKWGDGGGGTRTYDVLRGGSAIASGLTYPDTSYTDTTGTAGLTYSYAVRYENGCGSQATATAVLLKDDAECAGTPGAALKWHSGGKAQLDWGATGGATGYKVYRGARAELPNLAGAGAATCLAYQGASANTGAILTAQPPSGEFYWYLVAATKGAGEGNLGEGTSTARTIASSPACASP